MRDFHLRENALEVVVFGLLVQGDFGLLQRGDFGLNQGLLWKFHALQLSGSLNTYL